MCHFTNSTTNPFVEIDVDSAAVPAHEAIGDKVGHCTTTTVVVIKQMLGLVPAKTTPTSNGMLLMCLHRHTKTHQFVTVSMTNASATAAMHRHVALFGACTHAKVSLLKANGHRR